MAPVNLMKGKGRRNLKCAFYNRCLDVAAKKDWESFNCESCDNFKPGSKGEPRVTRAENKKVCKKGRDAKRHALILKEIEALIGKPRIQVKPY